VSRQVMVGALRTESDTADRLGRAAKASGLSINQLLTAIVRNALRSPEALVASVTDELVRVAFDPKFDR
jgi:hypothetical protein